MSNQKSPKEDKNIKIAVAKLRFFRVSCRKARPLITSLKGKSAQEGTAYLKFSSNRLSLYLYKLLGSCISNAENRGLKKDQLVIKEFFCDNGPVLKRFRPAHRGMALPYKRRLSHITVVLEETEIDKKSSKKQASNNKQYLNNNDKNNHRQRRDYA